MYKGYNKININMLCGHCRGKNTGVQGLSVEELYLAFYTLPQFASDRNNHQKINSMIVSTLLEQHDCTDCIDKIYACG